MQAKLKETHQNTKTGNTVDSATTAQESNSSNGIVENAVKHVQASQAKVRTMDSYYSVHQLSNYITCAEATAYLLVL